MIERDLSSLRFTLAWLSGSSLWAARQALRKLSVVAEQAMDQFRSSVSRAQISGTVDLRAIELADGLLTDGFGFGRPEVSVGRRLGPTPILSAISLAAPFAIRDTRARVPGGRGRRARHGS